MHKLPITIITATITNGVNTEQQLFPIDHITQKDIYYSFVLRFRSRTNTAWTRLYGCDGRNKQEGIRIMQFTFVLGILIPLAFLTVLNSHQISAQNSTTFVPYRNSSLGFSIEHPRDWPLVNETLSG
jgi:hypothetical protein